MASYQRWVAVGAALLLLVLDGLVYQQRLRATGVTSLFRAIETDRPAELVELHHQRVRPSELNSDGVPALVLAAHQADSALGLLLLRSGAPVDQRDPDNATPLMRASAWNRLGMVRALLASGADVNAMSNYGWTALHHAANRNHGGAIHLLLRAGASTEALRVDGVSALHLAAKQGYAEAVRELIRGGAAIKKDDKTAVEALLAAPQSGGERRAVSPAVSAPGNPAAGGAQPAPCAPAQAVASG